MKKCLSCIPVLLCFVLLLAGCGCQHEWAAANCTSPKTCELCGITEGEVKGHIWEDATCTVPKKCSVCHLTEGQALSHNWEEATTEAPKTCVNCQATEGSKLQTDPRFTTAATKDFHGKWFCEVVLTGDMMGMPGYFESLPCTLYYEFGKTGELIGTIELDDYLAFTEELKRMATEVTLKAFTDQGISQDLIDDAMVEVYGMTVEEYVDAYVEAIDMDDIFGKFTQNGVYYVGQNGVYSSQSWYEEFDCSEYTLENDVLIIQEQTLEEDGEPLEWKRVETE